MIVKIVKSIVLTLTPTFWRWVKIAKFKGIYVSLLTPFNEKFDVDYEILKDQINYILV